MIFFEGTPVGIGIGFACSFGLGTFFSWLWFGTCYRLEAGKLHVSFGPFNGSIAINTIRKVERGRTLWSGWRPALDTRGIIIRYNLFDEVYIIPARQEYFLAALLEQNPAIEVVEPAERKSRS